MRRVIAIVLLFLYLSVNIDLQEVMRVPFLWEHFNEHRRSTPETSFLAFVISHYFNGDTGDADAERHRQLPFMETHDIMPLSVALPVEDIYSLPDLQLCATVTHILYKSLLNCRFAQFNIWQPPKA